MIGCELGLCGFGVDVGAVHVLRLGFFSVVWSPTTLLESFAAARSALSEATLELRLDPYQLADLREIRRRITIEESHFDAAMAQKNYAAVQQSHAEITRLEQLAAEIIPL